MSSNTPAIVLVPGNFLPVTYYAQTAALLESHNFHTHPVTLPSTGSDTPLTSNEPDILAIRQMLSALCDSGKDVVVVAHSYGAIPACEAVKGLGKEERTQSGKEGGVTKLIFVAAWLLREGESAPEVIERNGVEAAWARFEGPHLIAADPIYAFHNDTSAATAAQWTHQTTHSDIQAFATPLKHPAWRSIPSTYLLCELDRCIPPPAQEDMLGRTEGKVRCVRVRSGHLPMLSVPGTLAGAIRGVVRGAA